MIKNYVFGKPYRTDAVVVPVDTVSDFKPADIPFVKVSRTQENTIRIQAELTPETVIYGLGETMGGINKRGKKYISYNTDDAKHRDDMPSMYGSHNFIVVDGEEKFGLFLDTPSKVIFDLDSNKTGGMDIKVLSDRMNLYLLTGECAYDIVRQFLGIIGKSHVPPLYAFGYGQSRWGYKNEKDIRAVAESYQKCSIPLDYICLDIDYMDRYIDFTVNQKRFPDMPRFVSEMKKEGIHLVPIIDAGIKAEPGNPVYEEGIEKDYFCKNEQGKPFKAAVWPGMTHFTDFLKPEARQWFGSKYKYLTDMGFDGFWNDMNEPAIFYTEKQKKDNVFLAMKNYLMPQKMEADGSYKGESNAYKGYCEFYHEIDGQPVLHRDVHNIYGAMMTRAAGEYLDKELNGKYFLFSRSSYIGAHRYGGIWTGDNNSSWHMLRQNLMHMANLNMVGFIYSGADTGGFGGNCSRELMLRWLALSVWSPLMRNHSAKGTKNQECYQYENPEDMKKIIDFRYRILPYLYESFIAAAEAQDMFIKPLAFVFDDPAAKQIEDQLMVGDSVMIAPVLEQGATRRKVYLPEEMTEVRYMDGNFGSCKLTAGTQQVSVPLDEIVFFVRQGHKIKIANKPAMHTAEIDFRDVSLLG